MSQRNQSPGRKLTGRPRVPQGVPRHLVISKPYLDAMAALLPDVRSESDRVNMMLREALDARGALGR
jgi:hypothetical protein